MLVAVVLVASIVTCMCWCYKRNQIKAEAHAIELQERIEREREMNLKRQEELEQQVENMASQVVVVHSQMKGTGWCIVNFSYVYTTVNVNLISQCAMTV